MLQAHKTAQAITASGASPATTAVTVTIMSVVPPGAPLSPTPTIPCSILRPVQLNGAFKSGTITLAKPAQSQRTERTVVPQPAVLTPPTQDHCVTAAVRSVDFMNLGFGFRQFFS
jgi:hypothetical protein